MLTRASGRATHRSFPSLCHVEVNGDVFRWVPGPLGVLTAYWVRAERDEHAFERNGWPQLLGCKAAAKGSQKDRLTRERSPFSTTIKMSLANDGLLTAA